jgi:hypothetical protein
MEKHSSLSVGSVSDEERCFMANKLEEFVPGNHFSPVQHFRLEQVHSSQHSTLVKTILIRISYNSFAREKHSSLSLAGIPALSNVCRYGRSQPERSTF